MARNQSHNIGSHVLSRFSQEEDLEDVVRKYKKAQYISFPEKSISDGDANNDWKRIYKEEKQKSLNEIIGDKNLEDFSKTQFFKRWEDKKLLNKDNYNNVKERLAKHELKNKRIAIFNNYIKERQELLAEITSTVPQIQTNKSLKTVLDNFTNNRILLDRISGLDNFKFTFKLDVQLDNGNEDVQVAIANDVLGQQALYIILENIIRNTAKHGSKTAKENCLPQHVIFTVRVRESTLNPQYYQITVFDNVQAAIKNNTSITQQSNKKLYQEFVRDNKNTLKCCNHNSEAECDCKIPDLDKLIIDQNELINRDILDNDNQLRTEALGLIEMKACAAYLRRLPLEQMEDEDFKLKFSKNERSDLKKKIQKGNKQLRILRAVNPYNLKGLEAFKKANTDDEKQTIKEEYSNRENVLGYRFYVPKPQELLLIDATEENKLFKSVDADLHKEALQNGVSLVGTKAENSNFKFDTNKIYPHEQLLVIG
ncbi:MAG: hypothetical protein KDD03_12945, partial [Gelidibacter sp.]|nr:hypothetical protein [Gelidibacter sp.]